jgi:hypothetical protein
MNSQKFVRIKFHDDVFQPTTKAAHTVRLAAARRRGSPGRDPLDSLYGHGGLCTRYRLDRAIPERFAFFGNGTAPTPAPNYKPEGPFSPGEVEYWLKVR